jgi:hypothetical protein
MNRMLLALNSRRYHKLKYRSFTQYIYIYFGRLCHRQELQSTQLLLQLTIVIVIMYHLVPTPESFQIISAFYVHWNFVRALFTRCVKKRHEIFKFRWFGVSDCQNFFFFVLVYMPLKSDKILCYIHCLLCLW